MDKMKMESVDIRQKNIDKIAELFPGIITEKLDEVESTLEKKVYKKAINFDMLRQLLSEDEIAGDEAYEFTWVGKKAAMIEANTPIRKTLRPCKEESKDWDTTENLYIEGDNLEVLKLLQESYLDKIKMIYIDPPYNTGNDFIYHDDFKKSINEYEEENGSFDNTGNRMFRNTDTNGRFHSDWCSMIYSRLQLSKNLLKNNGMIFISIDDSEIKNLKNICDEVFGGSNFVAQLVWQNKKGGGNDSKHIAIEHEYILVYAKCITLLGEFYESYSEEYVKRYKEIDEYGKFYWDTFKRKSGKQYYPIKCPDGTILEYDTDGNPISWLRSKSRFDSDKEKGEVRFVKTNNGWSVQFKQRIPQGKTPRSIFNTNLLIDNKGTTSTGSSDVYEYFKKDVFSNPKPVELLQFLLGFGAQNSDIILDFFSGSATISEAVMKANYGDGGKRKYIAVQLDENIDKMLASTSTNAKRIAENAICVLNDLNKPHTIPELAKERIRRAGDKILSENPDAKDLDIGFRVFKVDDSNMKDVYYAAGDYSQNLLDMMESNIKEDRNDLDLLYSCILEWGLSLSLSYESEQIEGITIHNVADGDLIACFDENVNEQVIREIADKHPLKVVFRDSSFANSPAKINVEEIFKLISPNTKIKVL